MALSAVMVIAATGCGKEDKGKEETTNSDALMGKWINYFALDDKVETDTLQFNKDGKGVQSLTNGAPNSTFTWTLKDTALTLVMKGDNVPATFDGETIVAKFWEDGYDLYMKEGDEGLGEETNRKNLIGTWIGSDRDDGKGATYKFAYVFGENGNGTYTLEISYDDGRSEKESKSFTWTISGVKLVIKDLGHDYVATCYNGKNELYLEGMKLTKGKDETTSGKENKGKEEATNSDALMGKWINYFADKAKIETWTLQFNKGGNGIESFSSGVPNRAFTWTLKGTALTLVLKGENVPVSFDGEMIVLESYLFIKEGNEGLGEETNRKNLIGTWIANERDDGKGATYKLSYVFGKDGNGMYTLETSYDNGYRPSENESNPFTWTLTGVKLVIKDLGHDYVATCYNGKEVLYLEGSKLTKK